MTTMTATATQVFQIYVKASPERVWEAITSPELRAKYFFGSLIQSWAPDRSALWGDNVVLECDHR